MKSLKSYLCIGLMLSSCATMIWGWEKDVTYDITILHTNDHHGRFWRNSHGEYGLAAQKTLVDSIRREVTEKGGTLLLLSGGDVNTGVPESDLQDAEPDFIAMKKIGYDAMAIGNHEFDNSFDVLLKQQQWAGFPFLSANIYDKGSQERLFQPYAIFDQNGVKIAVIGLTTEDTAMISDPVHIDGLEFKDPKLEAARVIEELQRTEKPDVIIAATHMGHYDNGQHGSNAPGDVEMARYLQAGALDLIVGGHSQNPVCLEAINQRQQNYVPGSPCIPDHQNGTWIVQAYEWGKYVGRADFTFKNGALTLVNYELVPVNLKNGDEYYTDEIMEDADLLDFLASYQEKGSEQLGIEIGETEVFLDGEREHVRYQQTNLGKLILQAQMDRTNADFGVIGGGTIRASLPIGTLTYRDVLTVQPFGNIIGYADLSGQKLIDYITDVSDRTIGSGGYAQWAGITFTKMDDGSLSNIKIADQPIVMDKTYRVAVPSYFANGGDGYPILTNYINTGFVDAEVLKEYIQKNTPITVDKVGE